MTTRCQMVAAVVTLLLVLGSGVGRIHALTESDEAIARWTAAYPVSAAWVSSILECESGMNPTAYNPASGASGIAEFMPTTFLEWRDRLNQDTRLAPGLTTFDPEFGDEWDVNAAIHVMVYALWMGQAWRWSCA